MRPDGRLLLMNITTRRTAVRDSVFRWILAVVLVFVQVASAQNVQHLSITQPGGMPGLPIITGIELYSNTARVTWDGPAGYYQLFKKKQTNSPIWKPVGGPNLARQAVASNATSNMVFLVTGPAPRYAGAQACAECHESTHTIEATTRHAGAFINPRFKAAGGQTNSSCLPCHTVGYGLPTGFFITNIAGVWSYTANLAGVQCENCHGPAANHVANENDPTVRPRAELASQVCGGCHTEASHKPAYDEWANSGHTLVALDINPPSRIDSCGRCHSGSARIALLKGENPSLTVSGDANVPITCATCHDPHKNYVWTNVLSGEITTNQLRNPVASTRDYFVSTSSPFAEQYDPSINLCAQCHNHRGASWKNTDRPPHHSLQYNMLLGTVGTLPGGVPPNQPAAHGLWLEKQCVTCHMQKVAHQTGQVHGVTGHQFKVNSYQICMNCHPFPDLLAEFTIGAISNQIQEIKLGLDLWATNKAPASLRNQYGARAWEYTTPGTLSNPAGETNAGPSTAEQTLIPNKIKKARFNLYLVLHDGSFGVHNAPYTATLLEAAENWIQSELNK